MNCYCGSQKAFAECCRPIIQGDRKAETPEELMRSRYSAFNHDLADYLVATHWPVEPASKSQIQQTIDSTNWIGLKVIDSSLTVTDHHKGFVEFVAFFEENGIQQLHEKSAFEKIDGRWFYTTGEHLPPIKLGRNDPCFCSSGEKFKKCHGG